MMKWVALAMTLLFCMSCCFCDNDDGDTPENGEVPPPPSGTKGDKPPSETPEVIDSQTVRLPMDSEQLFTWTSTGPGTLTAHISWTGSATLDLYLAKGGVVAADNGPSPLEVSAHVGAAGEVWTIGMQNPSATAATVSYTLTFLPD